MATAEFSKFAGILSAALSQHHFLAWARDHAFPSSLGGVGLLLFGACLVLLLHGYVADRVSLVLP